MKRLLSGLALSAFLAAPVAAADLPARVPVRAAPAPVYVAAFSWSGFYIGLNAGYHQGRDRATTVANPVGWGAAGAAAIDAVTGGTVNPSGFIGGGQLGYNVQSGSWLWGVEADFAWMGGSATRSVTGFAVINAADVFTTTAQSRFLGTIRGRIGGAFDRVLLYVTGGVAFGNLRHTDSFGSFGNTSIATVQSSSTRVGWTVGGGAEFALGNQWSLKAEYLYVDLGNVSATIPSCAICAVGSDIAVTHRYTDHIIRGGINYRFGGPVMARY